MQRRRSGRLLTGAANNVQPKKTEKDENAMNIVSRLSQKYLKNEKKTKQKQQLPPTRNLRNRSAGSIGSLSNSLNESRQSTIGHDTEDLYNFDLSEESLSMQLFPGASAKKKNVAFSYGKSKNAKKQNSKKTSVNEGLTKVTKTLTKTTSSKPKAAKPEKKRPFWETFTNSKPKDTGRKRRKLNSESSNRKVNSVPKVLPKPVVALKRLAALSETPSASSGGEQNSLDSGIFSPSFILSPVPKSTSTPCNDNLSSHPETSTPSILLAPAPDMHLDDEVCQYDYGSLPEVELFQDPAYDSFVLRPDLEATTEDEDEEEQHLPEPSPVKKNRSPRKSANKLNYSEYQEESEPESESPKKCRIPLAVKNYGNISFSGLTEREKVEKKKRKTESFKKTKGKYDKLAEEINKQFEEFDSYELSVDNE